jgi:3-oxo-5-alpha-steroid 4-dehydrogenase 1
MTQDTIYNLVFIVWLIAAVAVIPYLLFVAAPYGRHTRAGWGPGIPNILGWTLMEMPALVTFVIFFLIGEFRTGIVPTVFLTMWLFHYVYRSMIYPFRIRSGTPAMPVAIMGSGIIFNIFNGYIQGRYLFTLSGGFAQSWLQDPRFLLGLGLFLVGFGLNAHSDYILRNLRQPGEIGYKIPHGGFFRFVTSPNYLGEMIEWTGWAIATWSLAGAAFAFWTSANLLPRALHHHQWYHEKFPDYPGERRAIIPLVL